MTLIFCKPYQIQCYHLRGSMYYITDIKQPAYFYSITKLTNIDDDIIMIL